MLVHVQTSVVWFKCCLVQALPGGFAAWAASSGYANAAATYGTGAKRDGLLGSPAVYL